ncbi:polynucleotide adenylyltransferase PcnB [Pseudoalteromonas sp. Cnat2-41]|uniref:polynucleotide adenylyltransferase PcnB n=1 Tax=Pseudoalteromonas TaxID=53246 RepID=UPI001107ABDA|nr:MULTISPECIES: polynucleotide adenylyltransferase PcnB [Pseudoalteromonas]MCF2862170.1 polynucleotide adenylyltransferase PcnB [Pseudoalteromonas sp. CNAT2-18]MCG7558061.1 polynucleotide adenylyltransferase PcnB [Pseudoalteromonas sp. CNAT2-18.1]TLX50199.1 polynucleotide adenylyltransferase PcnB [Pseudoalteromonas ruthenica]
MQPRRAIIISKLFHFCRQALSAKEHIDAHSATVGTLDEPVIIPRSEHGISRSQFSPNALKVLYRLKDGGFEAYLVGGCVRDLLLGLQPKDFDVVTNATPEQVKKLFRNCRLIGRRFRLAHIVFGREIIEVATMRGHHEAQDSKNNVSQSSEHGQLLRDNVYGTIDEDAERRDFTINALYYSIKDFCIYDYANGVAAIKGRRIELIGDPETRYREDPVRMLRAIRFATKLDMSISSATAKPITELADLLAHIPPARLFEECLKLFLGGKAEANFHALRQYGLFKYLFPALDKLLDANPGGQEERFIAQMFANTDVRINGDKKVTPAFIFAALLWFPLLERCQLLMQRDQLPHFEALAAAMNQILSENARHVAVPKRFTLGARDIWHIQHRFDKRGGQRAYRLSQQPRFKAAYDFMLLLVDSGQEDLKELADWWSAYLNADVNGQKMMVKALGGNNRPRRRRRSGGSRNRNKPKGESQ